MKSKTASLRARAKGLRAFTLIELLAVIAIIAILAALLLATAGFVQEKAGNARAQSEIQAMTTALENYKIDFGDYPTSTDSTKILLDALDPTAPNAQNSTGKIYFEIPPKMLDGYSSKQTAQENRAGAQSLVDPFGNPYHYEYDPAVDNSDKSGKGQFNLWSQGKNNSTDKNRWIKNW